MTLFTEHSYSRVMVFIDYRNVYESTRFMEDHCQLDLYRLTQILVGSRDLVGAYVFDARKMFTNKDDETISMHNKLREQGFRVVARESMVFRDGKVEQKEVDVSLACEMLEHALMNHFDVAIVLSGDRDFVPVIQKVQSAGKRVEATSTTRSARGPLTCTTSWTTYRSCRCPPRRSSRGWTTDGLRGLAHEQRR